MNFHLRSQKGFGIIATIIAAALVVLIALGVSKILVDQSKISARISSANSCSDISQTVVNYLKQDGDSLDIHSMPIESDGTFPAYANAIVNADGNPRYVFGSGIGTPAMISSDSLQIAAGDQVNALTVVPNTYRIHNYLNINNSLSRLVSLGTLSNFCEWGTVYDSASGVNFLDGIEVSGVDLRIEMKADFLEGGQSICSTLGSLTRLPSSHRGLLARFDLRVTVDPQGTEPKSCEASSSVTLSSDVNAPAVVMHINTIETANRCDTQVMAGAHCIAGARAQTNNIVASVRTVQDTGACRTCLQLNDNKQTTCSPNLQNINLDTACAASCLNSDPGSIFYCNLTYRDQGANLNTWWPCHAKPNTIPGIATITYQDISGSLSTTQTTTQATIQISSLPSKRDWILDVRALDTAGQIFGPSFQTRADEAALPTAGMRDCSCDGSCVWTSALIGAPCSSAPAPTCPVGTPAGTPIVIPPAVVNYTVQCEHPDFPGIAIQNHNCVGSGPVTPQACPGVPCVAAATPNFVCTNWGAFGACAGGFQSRSGQCYDTTPNPDQVVPNGNCSGVPLTPNCVETIVCGGPPPPTYSCEDMSDWTDCTPDCMNQTCEETRSGTCRDDAGNDAPGMCGILNCVETRTDTATGCAFSCDTSAVVESGCSAGPCNEAGEIISTGAVCRDSSNAVVADSNCGGDCNPPPRSCDRGCTSNCEEVGDWSPLTCTTPCGVSPLNQQTRSTQCLFSDGSDAGGACGVCTGVARDCPEDTCSGCGSLAHGASQDVNTYSTAAPACGSTCEATTVTQTCNNGVLSPDLSGAITSCTNPVIGVTVCPAPPYCPATSVCTLAGCFVDQQCNPPGSCCDGTCPYQYCEADSAGCHINQCP